MRSALVILFAVLVSACGVSAGPTVDAPAAVSEVAADAGAEFSDLVVLDGRDAILAADGEPHILWFWGAL